MCCWAGHRATWSLGRPRAAGEPSTGRSRRRQTAGRPLHIDAIPGRGKQVGPRNSGVVQHGPPSIQVPHSALPANVSISPLRSSRSASNELEKLRHSSGSTAAVSDVSEMARAGRRGGSEVHGGRGDEADLGWTSDGLRMTRATTLTLRDCTTISRQTSLSATRWFSGWHGKWTRPLPRRRRRT